MVNVGEGVIRDKLRQNGGDYSASVWIIAVRFLFGG
jgi:hypothetical protein